MAERRMVQHNNVHSMSPQPQAGIALKFVITVIVISTNGPPKRSSTVKIQVALPTRSLLKASVNKALICQLLDTRQIKGPDVLTNIPKKCLVGSLTEA